MTPKQNLGVVDNRNMLCPFSKAGVCEKVLMITLINVYQSMKLIGSQRRPEIVDVLGIADATGSRLYHKNRGYVKTASLRKENVQPKSAKMTIDAT